MPGTRQIVRAETRAWSEPREKKRPVTCEVTQEQIVDTLTTESDEGKNDGSDHQVLNETYVEIKSEWNHESYHQWAFLAHLQSRFA